MRSEGYSTWSVSVRLACIDSRMLSTTGARLAPVRLSASYWRETTSKRLIAPSPLISGTVHAQFAEGLHFSAFHFDDVTRTL